MDFHSFTFPNLQCQGHSQWPAEEVLRDTIMKQRLIYQFKVEIKASFGLCLCPSYLSMLRLLCSVNVTFNYDIPLMFYLCITELCKYITSSFFFILKRKMHMKPSQKGFKNFVAASTSHQQYMMDRIHLESQVLDSPIPSRRIKAVLH